MGCPAGQAKFLIYNSIVKVILLEDAENIGKKYEVKEVKSGYARNFLIPRRIAKPATKQAIKWLEGQKEILAEQAEDDLKKAQELASRLDGAEITISLKVGEEGQLFESVNAQKISEKLNEMGFNVSKSQVKLDEPLKAVGEFPVKINLDHNLETEISLIITEEK